MNTKHFLEYVVRPSLLQVGLHSDWAERLVFLTAYVESRLQYLHQLHGGPAVGVCQMEPATHDDIWSNYLFYRPSLNWKARYFSHRSMWPGTARPKAEDTHWNLAYAVVMCRLHYYRQSFSSQGLETPLPGDFGMMAKIWKTFYNTPAGAGTEAKFMEAAALNRNLFLDGDGLVRNVSY